MYNWIKYKTLPPSVLFKNRLFLERDVKNRRIMSNLGLTFRNSKWSSYSRPNISTKLSENYMQKLRLSLLALFVLVLFIFIPNSYLFSYHYNNVTTLIWFFFDSLISYCLVVYFSVIVWVQMFLSKCYNSFINNYSWHNELTTNKSPLKHFRNEKTHLPKNLHKHLFFMWLKNKKENNLIEEVFTKKTPNNNLIPVFYQTINLLKNTSLIKPNTFFNSTDYKNANNPYLTRVTPHLNRFTTLLLDYEVQKRSLSNKKQFKLRSQPSYISNLFSWNLYEFETDKSFFKKSRFRQGVFYVPQLSSNSINHLNFNTTSPFLLSDILNESIRSIRSQYWLYKYNLLHRSTLKNLHLITNTKKLLNLGFYDSTLFKTNLWASTFFTENDLKSKSIFNLFYNKTTAENNNLLLKSQKNKFSNAQTLITFYQSSFLWFLKRSYFFNGLRTNHITSKYAINSNNFRNVTNQNTSTDQLLSMFLQVPSLSNNFYAGWINTKSTPEKTDRLDLGWTDATLLDKDLNIYHSLNSFFNYTNLNFLTLIVGNTVLEKKTYNYNPLSGINNRKQLNTELNNFKLILPVKNVQTFYPQTSLNEDFFVKDLSLILSGFKK